MKNLEKLLLQIEDIEREVSRKRELAVILRDRGQDLQADFCEMDLHYLGEDATQLAERVSAIERRAAEIAAFERVTGMTFDVAAMELPDGNLIDWWREVSQRDPEVAWVWAGTDHRRQTTGDSDGGQQS